MMMRVLVAIVLSMGWLVACGGRAEVPVVESTETEVEEPAVDSSTVASEEEESPEDEGVSDESASDESASDEGVSDEGASKESGEDAEQVTSEAEEAERIYSGIDPESGLEVNPSDVPRGQEFIVRGQIISANLTPQEKPEFVVKAPSGQNYRMGAQSLTEIFYEDGQTQLQPHEYRQGLEIEATVIYPLDAGPTDILVTENFTLIAGSDDS